jgi:hypothetical protein
MCLTSREITQRLLELATMPVTIAGKLFWDTLHLQKSWISTGSDGFEAFKYIPFLSTTNVRHCIQSLHNKNKRGALHLRQIVCVLN